MASWELDDEKMNSQVVDGDAVDQGQFDHYYHHHQEYLHVHGLSRLATCTTSNSTIASDNFEVAVDDEDDIHGLKTMLTRLSIEKIDDFGGDADEELSEGNNHQDKEDCLSSDYENDKNSASAQAVQGASYNSLPGTPLQHIRHQSLFRHIKQYSSENETRKSRRSDRRRRWKKRGLRRENMTITDDEEQYSSGGWRESKDGNFFSGESDQSGVLRVITRPKGGDHPLSMDIEEVKACRELGFDLELEMKMMPSLTVSAPVMLDTGGATTSSGGSSPISRWRISSPGDDPKEVKARLKVWAQAVALASTSPRSGGSC